MKSICDSHLKVIILQDQSIKFQKFIGIKWINTKISISEQKILKPKICTKLVLIWLKNLLK